MQIISNEKRLKNDTIQDLIEFNQQSLTSQAMKRKHLVSMKPAFTKAFNLLGDDIVELIVENESLKYQVVQYDEKWLQESKSKDIKIMTKKELL